MLSLSRDPSPGISMESGLGPVWAGHTQSGGQDDAAGWGEEGAASGSRMGRWGWDCGAVTAQS